MSLNIDPKEQASLQANLCRWPWPPDTSTTVRLYISHLRVIETAQYRHFAGKTDELLDSPEAALQKAFDSARIRRPQKSKT